MRIIIFLLLLAIFSGCDHPKKPYIEQLSWPKRTVKLDNDLGTLTIRLPKEFDTFYSWVDETDSDCGNQKKYRFQKSSFPISIESLWNRDKVDSIYYFTIEHDAYCDDNFILNDQWLKSTVNKIKLDDSLNIIKFKINEIKEINHSNFFIIGFENEYSEYIKKDIKNLKTAEIHSIIKINKKVFSLNFDCASHNCDSFIPKMYKALKTVEIK